MPTKPYEIIKNDGGEPVEVRAKLPDGRVACASVEDGVMSRNEDIPAKVRAAILKALRELRG